MNGSVFHSTWPVSLFGVRPLIRHALWRATFPVGEGDLPAGDSPAGAFPYLPLGEGGLPAGDSSGGGVPLPSPGGRWPPQRPEEGRYRVGPCTAPHPALRGHPLQAGEGWGFPETEEGRYRVGPCAAPHPSRCGVPPSPRRGFFQAIYASRSESFLTIREVMRNSTATKAKKTHWALVVSEVAMKS